MDARSAIDVRQNLVQYAETKLSRLSQCSPDRCIYRVRRQLREVNEKAFTPMLVSIGPFYHNDPNLLPMQVHKLRYLDSFLRASKENGDLHSYLQLVMEREPQIRQCYANPTDELSYEEFIWMVLTDSVFIIELFRRNYGSSPVSDDHIFGSPRMIHDVARDIKLAENQLPFRILRKLYCTAFRPDENINVPYFTDLACKFLNVDKTKIQIDDKTKEATYCHLLDLLRTRYLPSEHKTEVDIGIEDINIMCPSATSLYEAGVKIRVASASRNWFDIQFDKEKGVLTIPNLRVENRTEILFRNLTAFEQCHYPDFAYCSYYLIFLDFLVNTSEDVKLLVKQGIVDNWLGSDEDVCDLFNTLGKHVSIPTNRYYYAAITGQLRKHCNKTWNRYKATLKHTYFRHPWAVISVGYAAILLLLTIAQVVTGTLPLTHHNGS